MRKIAIVLGTALLAVSGSGAARLPAQLISVKSVPLATGDQFLIYPSRNLGMAGVTIALRDDLLDPFVNPALGGAVRETHFFSSPVYYSVSDDDGSGRTLPVGAQFTGGSWFGSVSFSLQQILSERQNPGFVFLADPAFWPGFEEPLSERSATNAYAFGSVGRRIPGTGVSVGASISYADLQAVDGVNLLYALSQRIEQEGSVADVRVGMTAEGRDGSIFEALLLHDRFDMTHDVTYFDWSWLPCAGPLPCEPPPSPRTRIETNLDRTRTWGLHLGYQRPVGQAGWSVGGIFTSNWKTHPKIPNYEIMNIPRDPGRSWAYDFGLGIARQAGPLTFGADLVWEPIWSHTWAEAAAPVTRPTARSSPGAPARSRTISSSATRSSGWGSAGKPIAGACNWDCRSVPTTTRWNRTTSSSAPSGNTMRTGWSGRLHGAAP